MSDTDKNRKNNPNRRHTGYLINVIILCVVALAAVGTAGFLGYRLKQAYSQIDAFGREVTADEGEGKVYWTKEEVDDKVGIAEKRSSEREHNAVLQQIQSSLESGESTLAMLRKLFPEDLVIRNGEKYYFYRVAEDTRLNGFGAGDFQKDDNGWLQYKGKETDITTENGIDVSSSNGEIDWNRAKDDGVEFAYVSLGGRNEKGETGEDSMFAVNTAAASAAGIRTGASFRLSVVSDQEAAEDADFVKAYLDENAAKLGISPDMPVAVKVNVPEPGTRAFGQSQEQWTSHVQTFCRALSSDGYTPMIYGNINTFTMQLDIRGIEEYDKWVADSDLSLYYPYDFIYWQYSSKGWVNGVDGDVSLDVMVRKKNG